MNTPSLPVRFARALGSVIAVLAIAFSCLTSSRANPGGIPAAPDHNPPFSSVVVLGDSLSDTGRTAGIIPGIFAFLYPSPPFASGRVSNGALWIEHLAPKLRLPYQQLDNFSWAGANTGTLNVFPGLPGMKDELVELIGTPPRTLDRTALYIVFGGANDFLRIFAGENPLLVVQQGVTNLIDIVIGLHMAGAQHIVVMDLPDIGRTPRALAGGPGAAQLATMLSTLFNAALNQGLDRLPFPVVRVSTFNLINNMVAHPHKYGLTNVTTPGVLNPASGHTHLFWDDVHPTTRAHEAVADAVFQSLASAGLLANKGK